ncbi:MAG TPA: hypothetical protein VF017_04710 [Thermoanaerobaculia bacterium]|nr:hypothetical protein [Thermoanaerobaculia bacterium]
MSPEELLAEVQALGVSVRAEGNVLRLKPASSIPPSLVVELRAHKPELLSLVSLQGWPQESKDYVRRFGRPEARLYPFLAKEVATPLGRGRLLQVFAERVAVALECDPHRLVYLLPSEVSPPNLARQVEQPFETAH